MKKYLIILILGQLFAESGFPGFNAWTSSSRLAMGGAGQLIKVPVAAVWWWLDPRRCSHRRFFS